MTFDFRFLAPCVLMGCAPGVEPRYVYTASAIGTILNATVSANGEPIFDVNPVLEGDAGYWADGKGLCLNLQSVHSGVTVVYHFTTAGPRDFTFSILNTITIAPSCEVFWGDAIVDSFEVEGGYIAASLLADYRLVAEDAPVECRQPFIFEMEVEGTANLVRKPAPSSLSYE